jgi:hypothetical protein
MICIKITKNNSDLQTSLQISISVSQDKVKTTTSAPSIGQDHHQQQRIPITTPKPRPYSQSPGGSFQDHSSHLGDNNKSNGVSSRESENPTATIRVEKNPNLTPGGVPPNEYTTISAAGRPLTLQKNSGINRNHFFTFGQSCILHIGPKHSK